MKVIYLIRSQGKGWNACHGQHMVTCLLMAVKQSCGLGGPCARSRTKVQKAHWDNGAVQAFNVLLGDKEKVPVRLWAGFPHGTD